MKKLNYYFMVVALAVSTFFLQCLTSCSEDEKVVPPLDIPSTLNNSSVKKVLCFDGMEGELSNVKFELLTAINESNGEVYEADMEMTLPMSIRTETASMTYNPFKFKVRAVSAEDHITFNGECLYRIGDVKISVEGLECNLSGLENLSAKLWRETQNANLTAAYVLDFVGKTLRALSKNLREIYPDLPILYAGGVMSNSIIKNMLSPLGNVCFAQPAFSADNAAGTALLCRDAHSRKS